MPCFASSSARGSVTLGAARTRSDIDTKDVLVGGELAAQLVGTGIVAETATLHVREWNASTLSRLRLVPAERGPITIRKTFGLLNGTPKWPGIAHPMLIRADLLTVLDERLDDARRELARRIEAELSSRWAGARQDQLTPPLRGR